MIQLRGGGASRPGWRASESRSHESDVGSGATASESRRMRPGGRDCSAGDSLMSAATISENSALLSDLTS